MLLVSAKDVANDCTAARLCAASLIVSSTEKNAEARHAGADTASALYVLGTKINHLAGCQSF